MNNAEKRVAECQAGASAVACKSEILGADSNLLDDSIALSIIPCFNYNLFG